MNELSNSTVQSLLTIALLTYPIKMLALWRTARGEQKAWFAVIAIFNTFGILDLAYLFYFTKDKRTHQRKKHNSKDKTPE